MKKVTDGNSYCRLHFVLVSFGPFEARVESKLIVAACICRDASVIRGIFRVRLKITPHFFWAGGRPTGKLAVTDIQIMSPLKDASCQHESRL
jgi:hypothetical protein